MKVDGKIADWREQLTIDAKLGANLSMHDLTSNVGIGSRLQDLLGAFIKTSLTSCIVAGGKLVKTETCVVG